jgi:hypothetical protein
MRRTPLSIMALAAIVALAETLAVSFAAKALALTMLERRVSSAWAPLGAALEQRYANIPRLVTGARAHIGADDDATRALTAASARFDAETSIAGKAAAGSAIEGALRELLLEQMKEYPDMPSEYDFAVARRSFQVTAKSLREPQLSYNGEVRRFRFYAAHVPNDLVARVLRMQAVPFAAPPPKAPQKEAP